MQKLPLNQIDISTKNVRKTLTSEDDETTISDLAENIKKNGLINPITVRLIQETGRYEVFAGQRRLLATRYLGNEFIDCG